MKWKGCGEEELLKTKDTNGRKLALLSCGTHRTISLGFLPSFLKTMLKIAGEFV